MSNSEETKTSEYTVLLYNGHATIYSVVLATSDEDAGKKAFIAEADRIKAIGGTRKWKVKDCKLTEDEYTAYLEKNGLTA